MPSLQTFFGFECLEIGVSVFGVLYMQLAAIIVASNVVNIIFDECPSPTTLIVFSYMLLLITAVGIITLSAAYFKGRKLCVCSMTLLVITLISFVILSGLSVYNKPELTKKICFRDHKCPETLWLPRVNYRTILGHDDCKPIEHYTTPWKTSTPHRLPSKTAEKQTTVVSEKPDTTTSNAPTSSTTCQPLITTTIHQGSSDGKTTTVKPKVTFRPGGDVTDDEYRRRMMVKNTVTRTEDTDEDVTQTRPTCKVRNSKSTDENTDQHTSKDYCDKAEYVEEKDKDSQIIFSMQFIFVILVFLFFNIFILYTIILVWSYYNKLEIPSTIPGVEIELNELN